MKTSSLPSHESTSGFLLAQAEAHRLTRQLLMRVVLGAALLVTLLYALLVLIGAALATVTDPGTGVDWVQPYGLFACGVLVIALVAGGSRHRRQALAGASGEIIARQLDGRRLRHDSTDPLDRRLIEVCERSAVAAGMPVPALFVLDNELRINALTAGVRSADATLIVTRGALEHLDHDALQGLIARELGRVLSGDMRLNHTVMVLTHGLQLVTLTGQRLSARGSASGLAGRLLTLVGLPALWVACSIRSPLSRKRTFSADALGAMLSRHPSAIRPTLDAIRLIGSELVHPDAALVDALCLAPAVANPIAAHPPVDLRLQRLGHSTVDDEAPTELAGNVASIVPGHLRPRQAIQPSAGFGRLDADGHRLAEALAQRVPESIQNALTTPSGAAQALIACLLDEDGTPGHLRQLERVAQHANSGTPGAQILFPGPAAKLEIESMALQRQQLGSDGLLPLITRCLPRLRSFDDGVRIELLTLLRQIVGESESRALCRQVALNLVRDALRPVQHDDHHDLVALRASVIIVLTLCAQCGGQRAPASRLEAFLAGARLAPLPGIQQPAQRTELQEDSVDAAIDQLAGAAPGFRIRLADACAGVVFHDRDFSLDDRESLRMLCAALDCPLPLNA